MKTIIIALCFIGSVFGQCGAGGRLIKNPLTHQWDCTGVPGGGSSAFSALTSGTNTTATMVVGSGATLTYSGSGGINASAIGDQALGSTLPTAGNLLIGSGVLWATRAVSGDVTISSTGVVAIGATKVTNAMLAGSIAASKFIGTDITLGTLSALFLTNAKTATYQVLAADFSQCKTIPVASGTFTITLVASGSQPADGQCLRILNYGSGVVTLARSGQNINGGTSSLTLAAGTAASPTGVLVTSNGTDYFAQPIGGAGTVTSVICGTGLTGGTITSTGTCAVDTTALNAIYARLGAANIFTGIQTLNPTSTDPALIIAGASLPSSQPPGSIMIDAAGQLHFNNGTDVHTVPFFAGSGVTPTAAPTTGNLTKWSANYGLADLGTAIWPLANGGTNCATPYAVNPQTSTYQALLADFTCSKTISVASGTFTITLVASGGQPVAGSWIRVLNYGSGVVTIARSGQNINGGTTSITLAAGSASAPTGAIIQSDGTNFFSQALGASSSGGITGSLTSGRVTVGAGASSVQDYSTLTYDGAILLSERSTAGYNVNLTNTLSGSYYLRLGPDYDGGHGAQITTNNSNVSIGTTGNGGIFTLATGTSAKVIMSIGGSTMLDVNSNRSQFSNTLETSPNCTSSASPAVCTTAIAGRAQVAASASTVVVNTSSVHAASQIFVTFDSSLTGLGTCNTTDPGLFVSARTASTSFTVSATVSPVTNPACFSFLIVN